MESIKHIKMSYFEFLSLPENQMTGHFHLTLKHDNTKIVTTAYFENGVIVGSFRDYIAWDYLISEEHELNKDKLYKSNPIAQVGFYTKQDILEGEFLDFEYK